MTQILSLPGLLGARAATFAGTHGARQLGRSLGLLVAALAALRMLGLG